MTMILQQAVTSLEGSAGATAPPTPQDVTTDVRFHATPACDDDAPTGWPRKVDLFGVGVSATTYDEATAAIMRAARRRVSGVVSCQAVHAVMTTRDDPALRARVATFEIVTPDGQPVRWALNLLHDAQLRDRVYGPELMLRLCQAAADTGTSIYLYGGSPEVATRLRARLTSQLPGLRVAGCESPPFRALSRTEDAAVVHRINQSGAGLVFIGLGCPKQDLFAADHRDRIQAMQICVGAAFDFHAGAKPMAPVWMQRRGLEWVYRLAHEPSRLWSRYLVTNTQFVVHVLAAWVAGVGSRGVAERQIGV